MSDRGTAGVAGCRPAQQSLAQSPSENLRAINSFVDKDGFNITMFQSGDGHSSFGNLQPAMPAGLNSQTIGTLRSVI